MDDDKGLITTDYFNKFGTKIKCLYTGKGKSHSQIKLRKCFTIIENSKTPLISCIDLDDDFYQEDGSKQ